MVLQRGVPEPITTALAPQQEQTAAEFEPRNGPERRSPRKSSALAVDGPGSGSGTQATFGYRQLGMLPVGGEFPLGNEAESRA